MHCECGEECTLGLGEMGETTDEAERVVDEWLKENGVELETTEAEYSIYDADKMNVTGSAHTLEDAARIVADLVSESPEDSYTIDKVNPNFIHSPEPKKEPSYYERQLSEVLGDGNKAPKFAPQIKVTSNGNGKSTNFFTLHDESARELIYWLAKNFVSDSKLEYSPTGITVFF